MSESLVRTATESLTKSLGKSSLDDFLKASRRSMMLVDVSSSMNEHIRSGGTKIAACREVCDTLRESNPVPVAAFGGVVELVDRVPNPSGGTPLHRGIEFAQGLGADHLVVITDGEPDSESAALAAARAFGGVIDVFYIGNGDDSGSRFAAELAKLTGGSVNLTDLAEPKQLAGRIVGLLGE
jgi:hypothetical protein